MAREKVAQARVPSPGSVFMSKLGQAPDYALKRVAAALYHATKQRQEALLSYLRNGNLVASGHWPGSGYLVDLPPTLWNEFKVAKFTVRRREDGRWKTDNLSLPPLMLIQHVIVPQLESIADDRREAPAISESADGLPKTASGKDAKSDAEGLLEVIRLIKGTRTAIEVVVTAQNAKVFADNILGPIIIPERRGRNRTSNTEHLLIEMFRQLHLVPVNQLPNQKAFVAKLTKWWNAQPDFETRGNDWVQNYAKLVWAALKRAPTL